MPTITRTRKTKNPKGVNISLIPSLEFLNPSVIGLIKANKNIKANIRVIVFQLATNHSIILNITNYRIKRNQARYKSPK